MGRFESPACRRRIAVALAAAAALGGGVPAAAQSRPLPGAEPHPPELRQRLAAALESRGPGTPPRTRHLGPDGTPLWSNRLLLESSPYLLQHAHNPVDWYPWGEAAFAAARRLGRPILLSIGYSTCHWCHVMEEESFDDPGVAELINRHYVAIKVDREERPDVDAVYMAAVQMLTGGLGGWPMTLWLTSEREPFYGATYLPPEDGQRGIRLGFRTLLERLADVHARQPDQVAQSAARVVDGLRETLDADVAGARPPTALLERAVERIGAAFDPSHGGRRGPQKFPRGLPLRLLLRHHRRSGDEAPLRMALRTLEAIRDGGLRDHVGGGIHRYTTDPEWRVPHFEKMLYDNALLVLACLEANAATPRPDLVALARESLAWAEREMSHPEGGFYSATDADSPGPAGEREEGRFFTWTEAEVRDALDPKAAQAVIAYYGVEPEGPVEGRNVLHVEGSLEELAAERGETAAQLEATLAQARTRLRERRAARPAPARDEKVLTGWNGLMISAFARAALALGEPALAARAERAAGFVLARLRPEGRLLRSWAGGEARHAAVLEDYALLCAGLIDLYEATGVVGWLEHALELDSELARDFEQRPGGGFFTTAAGADELLVRARVVYDGALPSGNGAHVANLARLAILTGDDTYRERGEAALAAFAEALAAAPEAAAEALLGMDLLRAEPREVVIVVPEAREQAEPFLVELRRRPLPGGVLCVAVSGADLEAQSALVPLLAGKVARDGRATAYLCRRGVCRLPTTDPEAFARLLEAESEGG